MNFLTGKDLTEKIYDTIYNSEEYLFILSPFIQLDNYFKDEVFKTHLNNASVHIIIGFGKNENNVNRSFKKEDIEFFTKFPNITIVYIPNLHAKYYGNEKKSVITSMNLLDYSFKNNIEFGVYCEKKLINITTDPFFESAFNTCLNIVEEHGFTIFVKRPKYRKKMLIMKDYVGSDTELDLVSELISNGTIKKRKFSEFRDEKYVNIALKEERKAIEVYNLKNVSLQKNTQQKKGYCIRCKNSILHNLEKPLCRSCYQSWQVYENPFFPEKYCIYCGEKKNTSFNKPACYECYIK